MEHDAVEILQRIHTLADPSAVLDDRGLHIKSWHGVPLDEPLLLPLSVEDLSRRLEVDEDTRASLWPSRTREEAGVLLFMNHIGEMLAARNSPQLTSGLRGRLDQGRRVTAHAPLTGRSFPSGSSRS